MLVGGNGKMPVLIPVVYPEIRRDAFGSKEISFTDFHSGERGKFL